VKGLVNLTLAIGLLTLVLPRPTLAGEMTLADCISTALEANRGILDAREALAQARSGIFEARSGFMPSLALSGSYNFLEKTQKITFPGAPQPVELDFTKDYSLQLALSQPVYTGGRLSSSYRISTFSREIAQADLERQQADMALSVMRVFYSLLLAKESVRVAEEAIKTAEEFLRVVEARYKVGEASSFEVMRAEVEVSNLKPALIGAKNGVALSGLALKNAMSIKADQEVTFVGSFDDKVLEVGIPDAIRGAIANRPELRMLKIRAEIAGEGLRFAKAGRLPTVAVTASYDFLSNDLSFESDRWDKTYSGYLVMSLPIFDGLKTKSQISRSLSEIKQAEIALANVQDGVELEVRSAILDLEAAFEGLRSQEKNVEMAQEGLKIANDRYVQGVATNLEVMDAQLALTRAKNYRLQALHDMNLASATLKRAMGVLLDDYKRPQE
jgi:outer membrane protein TolC